MPVRLLLAILITIIGGSLALSQDQQPPSCQEQLMAAKAMAGNFQNDYMRKVNELTNAQVQASKALQKVQLLERELAALRKPPEEPK